MRIRIATRGWSKQGRAAHEVEDAEVGVAIPWVELDGHRTSDVISAKVEAGKDVTLVTVQFLAAAEMVLVNDEGDEL